MTEGRNMTEAERRFYKKKMKEIKQALKEGDEAKADRAAFEIRDYFNID